MMQTFRVTPTFVRGSSRFASRWLLSAAMLCGSAAVLADDTTALQSCAKIEDLSARLSCYDGLSSRGTPTTATPAAIPAPAPEAAAPPQPSAPPEPAATVTVPPATPVAATPGPAPVSKPISADEQAFGSEALPRPPGTPTVLPDANVESIRSRIAGEFTGWERGSLFTLVNGQVWKCIGFNSLKYTATSPVVTIERGVMATYILQIEGISKKATVRRVK